MAHEYDLVVKEGITIPGHEIAITASLASGPGGQHVNKTNSRITIRWNVSTTQGLTVEQKQRVLEKLAAQLTTEGDLIIHASSFRSQQANKEAALRKLKDIVRAALYVPKKRKSTRMPASAKAARLDSKAKHGNLKRTRRPVRGDE